MRHKVLQPRLCDYITHLVLEHVWSSCIYALWILGFSCIASKKAAIFVSLCITNESFAKTPKYEFVNIDLSLEQSIWCVAEVVKPSTTASPYVELKYEWPIKGK